jgi:type II secretory pathway pseudopilin PulG/uncharacterized membrane protein
MADEKPQEEPKKPPKQVARIADCLLDIADCLLAVAAMLFCVILVAKFFGMALADWPDVLSFFDLMGGATLILIVMMVFRARRVDGVSHEREDQSRYTARIRTHKVLVVVALFLGCLVSVLPGFLEAQIRAKLSRIRDDMRNLAKATEAYRSDHRAYPAWATGVESVNGWDGLPSFRLARDVNLLQTLTTPVNYLAAHSNLDGYPRDPFAPERQATFAYYSTKSPAEGWILTSAGPDRDYDIDPMRDYDPAVKQPSAQLLGLSYDPTNGTVSNGDIWRVRQ